MERLRAAPRARRAAGLPEVIRLIQSLSAHVSDVDISALADVIQKDAAILAKVLATAQTLGFNATGAPVGSVAQAIHIIGFARLRSITMGFVIASGAEHASAAHRRAAATAICAGFVAHATAHHYFICDPEEAFVLSCLRQFGRLVLAAVMPVEYGDGLRCEEVFGLSALEVARRLLAEEKVPGPILDTMRPWRAGCTELAADGSPEPLLNQLVALCEFSSELAEHCISGAIDDDSIAGLGGRFASAMPDLPSLAPSILSQAGSMLRRFLLDRGIQSLPPAAIDRFCRRTVVSRSPTIDCAETLARLLQAFDAQDIAVFRRRDGREEFSLCAGTGPFFRQLFPDLSVRTTERTLAGLCLQRRENILIHDAADPKMARHLPAWLSGPSAPAAFALFPAIAASGPRALVVVGWAHARRIAPPAGFSESLTTLLGALPRRSMN